MAPHLLTPERDRVAIKRELTEVREALGRAEAAVDQQDDGACLRVAYLQLIGSCGEMQAIASFLEEGIT